MAEEKKTTKRKYTKKAKTQVEPVEVKAEEVEVKEEPKSVEEPKPVVEVQPEQNKLAEAQSEIELLKQQLVQMQAQMAAQPQVIQIANDTERVDFMWLAPVADENEFLIGGGTYGKITGKVGNFSIPKNNLSQILDSLTRKFIQDRWLIVLSGLTDEERVMYGVDYKPGEHLEKAAFMRLLDIKDEIVGIYEKLCDASKEVVAKMYYEAWLDAKQKKKIKRETVVAMNKIKAQPALKAILDDMNKAEAE